MSHTVRTATAIALFVLSTAVAAVDISAAAPSVVIRLYDTATTDRVTRREAMQAATAIVEEAGVAVEWRDCSHNATDEACRRVRNAGDLILRIMPTQAIGHAPRGAVSTRRTEGDADLALGFAAVDAATHDGVIATMFHDRVMAVALRAGLAYSELLGRAMAHEIGHLLLRTAGHGRSGLMRAIWTDAELAHGRQEDWVFAPPERERLHANTDPITTP